MQSKENKLIELTELANRVKEQSECGNADHLTDSDGNFVSTFKYMCIGYLSEVCQWIFYNDEIEDKLDRILVIEKLIQDALGEINFIPTWSVKIKNK